MSSTWQSLFERQREALARAELGEVASAIASAIAAGEDVGELKRFARGLAKDASATIDPWRVELALARPEIGRRIVPLSPLRASTTPSLGLTEPETHLRMLELARRILAAIEAGARELPAELEREDGAREAWWWLTGERAPEPRSAIERRLAAMFATAADRALGPFGLLCSASRRDRKEKIAAWADRERPSDPFERAFREAQEACEPWIERAVAIVVEMVRSRGDCRPELDRAATLLGELRAGESDEAGLARWCAAATALGILGAAPVETEALRRYRNRVAAQLCAELDAHVKSGLASRGFAFWQAFVVLVRDRAGDAALETLLETASAVRLTGGVAKRLARLLAMLSALGHEDAARSFALRSAYRTSRDAEKSAEAVWKDVLARCVKALAPSSAARTGLERWFGPDQGTIDLEEALDATRRIAGPELDDTSQRACAAFWDRPAQRAWRERHASSDRGVARIADALRASPPSREEPRADRLCLAIERFQGRHGEVYLKARVLGHDGRAVSVLLSDDTYDVAIDRRESLAAVRAALARLRGAAEMGRAPKSHVRALADAMGALASQRFWSELASMLAERRATLELPASDFDLPWEIVALGASPLAVTAPIVRPRGALRREPRVPERVLVLFDPTHPGAIDEVDRIEELFGDREVVIAERAAQLGELEGRFDVVHYAGHQGPASDATPSLALGDGRVSILALTDLLHAAPPDLLFLHACSTLAPTRKVEEHTVYGALEPLLRSRVPAIVGTLWDVAPPEDRLFVRVFYRELLEHGDPARAIFAARVETSPHLAWASQWPAYVLIAP